MRYPFSRWVSRFAIAVALVFGPASARAAEVWIVCFWTGAVHYPGEPDCEAIQWQDQQFFLNTNSTTATVRVIGLSNALTPIGSEILIPPNGLMASPFDGLPVGACYPGVECPPSLFVAHLDVPDGVVVSSRAETLAILFPCAPAGTRARLFAGMPLPVKRALTPAGITQYHLGIDTGSDECAGPSCLSASARLTIGIYDSAAVPANATIEIRRGCDDGVIERRPVTVPANSVVHFGGFPADTSGCGPLTGKAPGYVIYAVVTVDQPSFSYAISLRNDMPPKFAGTAPVTQ